MIVKMGVVAAVLLLALPGCREMASIAAPEAEKVSIECPNPQRTLEILAPQTGACLTCGCCANVCWRMEGTVGDVRAKVEAWYGNKHEVLGTGLLNCTSFAWQLPEEEVAEVTLRVSALDDRGRVGVSEAAVSIVAPRRGADPPHHFTQP